jgi:hypothetical protein
VQNHKRSGDADIAARDGVILLSWALQYGAPLEGIARALSQNSDGAASGVMAAVVDEILKDRSHD